MRVIIPVAGDYVHAARVLIKSLATVGMPTPASGSTIVLAMIGEVCDDCRERVPEKAGEWTIEWFDSRPFVSMLPTFDCASERYNSLYAKLAAYAIEPTKGPTWMMDADLFCMRPLEPLFDVGAWAGTASRTGEHEEFGLPNDPRTCISAGFMIVETGKRVFDVLCETAERCLTSYGEQRKRQGDEWILAEAFGSHALPQPTILSARYNWFSLGKMSNGPDAEVDPKVSIIHLHNGRWKSVLGIPNPGKGTWAEAYMKSARAADVQPMRVERRRCRC